MCLCVENLQEPSIQVASDKLGFHILFKSDKVILSKSRMFVGKSYASDEMFKLNIMAIKPK